MIKSYRCRNTEALFNGKRVARFVNFERAALRKLEQLDLALVIDDIRAPPGNRLETQKDDRAGQWSMCINDPWHICFLFKDGNALDMEVVGYH